MHQQPSLMQKAKARAKVKAATAPKAQPAPAPVPAAAAPLERLSPRPVGRQLATSVEILTLVAWMHRLLADVADAGEVLMASCVYDHPGLTAALVRGPASEFLICYVSRKRGDYLSFCVRVFQCFFFLFESEGRAAPLRGKDCF